MCSGEVVVSCDPHPLLPLFLPYARGLLQAAPLCDPCARRQEGGFSEQVPGAALGRETGESVRCALLERCVVPLTGHGPAGGTLRAGGGVCLLLKPFHVEHFVSPEGASDYVCGWCGIGVWCVSLWCVSVWCVCLWCGMRVTCVCSVCGMYASVVCRRSACVWCACEGVCVCLCKHVCAHVMFLAL